METHAPKAVFISYASQDVESARRIADALRAFGVEVWFDQSELRGGDAWGQKIKKEIHECTLFLPLISATTQARAEGYFRREWKLAVERTHDMSAGVAFIVPVVIDETREAEADVPEEFMRYQWTRLARGVPSPQFVEQMQRLLGPQSKAAPIGAPTASGVRSAQGPRSRFVWKTVLTSAMLALVAAGAWWKLAPHGAPSVPSGPPVVVLMDSPNRNRVYDPETLQNGGTNADDITDVLHDLPITIVKEATSRLWRRENEILRQHPALIVIHYSCFNDFEGAEVSGGLRPYLSAASNSKLVAFLGYVATVSPQTKFLVYTRNAFEVDSVAAQWRAEAASRFPALEGKIETWRVPLDRPTFRNPLTGRELKDSVEKALGLKVVAPASGH